ncbi:hypothetical protein WNY37_16685 [Henriciella sp. AS95]|uniref:hypothetical protein n=1 Tax=Henriciella sp. AS95 TaxID=3135782 RepID=UPI00316CB249
MSSQPPGGTPVLYEDRTLFPTPIQEPPQQQRRDDDVKTGLSAGGVLMVAFLAAAVAGALVWAALTFAGPSDGTPASNPELEQLRADNEALRQTLADIEEKDLDNEITGYQTKIAELEAQIDNYGEYGELAGLEQQIAARKAEIERLIAQPERQRMPASAKAIPEPENDTAWVARVESELEDYLEVLEDRVEWVAAWPARNPLPPCSDPENC